VLEVAQLAARPDHAEQLIKRAVVIAHAAQHEACDSDIE
jgi:hypothetical protein